MNIVLTATVEEFARSYEFDSLSTSKKFEYFSAYCLLSSFLRDITLSKDLLKETVIGGGDEWGIDAFAIIINGRLVNSEEDITCIAESCDYLHTRILLIQTKTSDSLNTAEFNTFATGTVNIFKTIDGGNINPDKVSPQLQFKLDMLKYLYSRYGAKLRNPDGNPLPSLLLRYVHAGDTDKTTYTEATVSNTSSAIGNMHLVANIDSLIITGSAIKNLYDDTTRQLECSLALDRHLPLPSVDKIKESHLCLLPFSEFRKLIIDENGNLMRKVFEDNVRDFQGDNPVNKGIEKSLHNSEFKLFTAMNNGVTITCRDMSIVGNKMTLWDYQIVNGCQTCNVLYRNRNLEGIDNLVLSVKIISSTDKEIRDKIIIANNSQTVVERPQLTSLLNTQRQIESFYIAQNRYTKLYYERRSKQYRQGHEKIPAGRIVTIPSQIFSFMSMVLEEPHLTRRYYGQLVQSKSDQERIFNEDNKPALYFMSALTAYCRDKFFDDGLLPATYRKVKHHLLLAFRLVAIEDRMPAFNSNSTEKYCDKICSLLCDSKLALQAFKKAIELIDEALDHREPEDKDGTDKTLTERIKQAFYTRQQADRNTLNTQKPIQKETLDNPSTPSLKIVGKIDLSTINDKRPKKAKK